MSPVFLPDGRILCATDEEASKAMGGPRPTMTDEEIREALRGLDPAFTEEDPDC